MRWARRALQRAWCIGISASSNFDPDRETQHTPNYTVIALQHAETRIVMLRGIEVSRENEQRGRCVHARARANQHTIVAEPNHTFSGAGPTVGAPAVSLAPPPRPGGLRRFVFLARIQGNGTHGGLGKRAP